MAALKVLQADPDATYTLEVRGETYTVVIQSVEAEPLFDLSDDSDSCALTLKMIEVSAAWPTVIWSCNC